MNLFVRLTRDVNERLRTFLRYRGDLSRYVEEALTETNLNAVELIDGPIGRATRGTTAVVCVAAYERLEAAARARGCTMAILANSAIKAWLKARRKTCHV